MDNQSLADHSINQMEQPNLILSIKSTDCNASSQMLGGGEARCAIIPSPMNSIHRDALSCLIDLELNLILSIESTDCNVTSQMPVD